ncbi:MAG TPA: NAD(P)-dependent oxidoreductase [Elusimicrobiota bacterium]|nr:NAD(P)-dependent oxidoreductase [Elusimicrobiota bacterium]
MKIALIGASGNVGSRVASEALSRGHRVTGIARRPERIAAKAGLTAVRGDAASPEALSRVLAGHDAVVSSTRFQGSDSRVLLAAVKKAGVKRLLVVGGAGSLEVAPGRALIDSPEFPAAYKPEASAGRDFLEVLRGEKELDWTFLSPSAFFGPGERTGKFRLGGDALLVGPDGKSRVSMEDYAIALVDELEAPRHSRRRFTVGY